MRTIEMSGSSIDQAIFNGLQQLEISIDEVEIEIIQQESKGILGIGARPAKVRLTEKAPEAVIEPEYLREPPRPPRERDDRRGRRDDRRDGRRSDYRTAEPRPERSEAPRRDYRERSDAGRPESRPPRPRREENAAPARPPVDYTLEAAQNDPGAIFLKGLLAHMGVEGHVLANINEEGVRLCIDTPSMGVLIGHRGETLDALQYLTSLCVNRNRKAEGYTRITLDTEGYRIKREETLARLARKVAGQVKATGRPRVLEPMNPSERRVLHATLQTNPYVTTHSEGEEPNRHVVIAPKPRGAARAEDNGQ